MKWPDVAPSTCVSPTCFDAWHITFDGDEPLRRLVDRWQSSLRSLEGLDLIPHGWLHLTVQGVGMVADVPTAQRDAIVAAVRTELAALPPPVVTFHQPVVRPEAIALPPAPVEQVQQLRAAIRTGMAAVMGDAVPESPSGFQPHVSIA
jgi:2'-5' RNA ligase